MTLLSCVGWTLNIYNSILSSLKNLTNANEHKLFDMWTWLINIYISTVLIIIVTLKCPPYHWPSMRRYQVVTPHRGPAMWRLEDCILVYIKKLLNKQPRVRSFAAPYRWSVVVSYKSVVPIPVRVISLALEQPHSYLRASNVTLNDMCI